MQAKDVMTTPVVTVSPQTLIEEVARVMLERRVSAVPVVDTKGRMQGIVSEGDLIRRVETGTEKHRSWWLDLLTSSDVKAMEYVKSRGRTAGDVMTREVVTVSERATLAKIATLLERHRIKRVPVVRDGKVVGIVSRANLLHGLVAQKSPTASGLATDREIRARVIKEIERADVDRSYVNIVVAKGIVELWGLVKTEQEKRALGVAARNVKGVTRVVDNVTLLAPNLQAFMGTQ